MSWRVIEVELDDGLYWFTRCSTCAYFSAPFGAWHEAAADGESHECSAP